MSNFIYSTQISLDGPWLIDRDALLHLGRNIESISAKFANANKEYTDNALTQTLERYSPAQREEVRGKFIEEINQRYAVKRKITLSCSKSKYIEDDSIERLLSLPEMLDESPTDIEVEIKTAHRSARIQLENGIFSGSKLSIRTTPETDELAREAFVELQQWAVTNQAPIWQRLWANNYGIILFIWMLLLFFSASVALLSKSEYVEQELRADAIQILKNGISNEKIPDALELLLRYEFKIPKTEVSHLLPTWFKIFLYGGLASCLVLYFRPSLVIGVGRNEQRIKRWRWWIKFVGITLPGFIFISIIWPYISELLGLHQ